MQSSWFASFLFGVGFVCGVGHQVAVVSDGGEGGEKVVLLEGHVLLYWR